MENRITDAVLARKTVLDVTCGTRSIWFDKHDPSAVYCDRRREDLPGVYAASPEYVFHVDPDVVCDFTDLPFDDASFRLVVFDPPHLKRAGERSYMAKKYGVLPDDWRDVLRAGFQECMRVLKPGGTLVFKWSEHQIPARAVWEAIGQAPLFGHRSGKASKTLWAAFLKPEDASVQDRPARFRPGYDPATGRTAPAPDPSA